MGRAKLEAAGPPGSAARLRVELTAADWIISVITWGSAAGVIVWSMLNATPYVRAHVPPGSESIAFVLPVVVDLAFVGSLRADEIASRYGASGGIWAGALRLFTGGASLFLNIGHSLELKDWTGVGQHLIAPGILVLVAEAGPAYRRRLAARLTTVETEEAAKAKAENEEAAAEAERRRVEEREEADRQEQKQRADEDRRRQEEREEEDRRRARDREDRQDEEEREERRESGRQARELERRRLDLEAQRLAAVKPAPVPAAVAGTPAPRAVAPVAPAPVAGETAPEPRTAPVSAPAVAWQADTRATAPQARTEPLTAVSPARTAPPAGQVHARVSEAPPTQQEPPAPAAPEESGEHQDESGESEGGERLGAEEARRRIEHGWGQKWSTRRTAEYAGRSATFVGRVYRELNSLPKV
ncbi:hypothetical protein ACFRR7_36785 [Streptomyces sp. NPDC056909]|uniref:hypothetical protein n=1 Tax=Streptomyces sp. NPDC056909 TaxID=3345963 RepID=UPI0036B4A258